MNKPNVLLVNDNPKSRKLLASALEQQGFAVVPAAGPEEALHSIERASFDLALLEYVMSKKSGTQLALEIRVLQPSTPIIVLSGVPFLSKSELSYVDAHVGPGSSLEELVDTMRTLVGPGEIACEARRVAVYSTDWT
jgi:DNA-binding NarL/FixJ family response regulator